MKKPKCKLTGEGSNIFHILSIATKTLQKIKQKEKAKEMADRVITDAHSFGDVLLIIGEYVDIM